MPCGGTWWGIWQFGGKLLIDDTDMGSNGERRNHQFTNPLRKLNAEIMEREYFSCLNPLQWSKYSPLSLSLFSLKTEITPNLWTNSLYIILSVWAQPHPIFAKQNPNIKEIIWWQGWKKFKNKWEFLYLILKSILGLGRGNWCSPR